MEPGVVPQLPTIPCETIPAKQLITDPLIWLRAGPADDLGLGGNFSANAALGSTSTIMPTHEIDTVYPITTDMLKNDPWILRENESTTPQRRVKPLWNRRKEI